MKKLFLFLAIIWVGTYSSPTQAQKIKFYHNQLTKAKNKVTAVLSVIGSFKCNHVKPANANIPKANPINRWGHNSPLKASTKYRVA